MNGFEEVEAWADSELCYYNTLKEMVNGLLLLLGLLNLLAGLALAFLGGKYLLSLLGLIDMLGPRWIGWFVDDLFRMGMSARSTQAVVWVMVILGASLIITSTDYLRIRKAKLLELANRRTAKKSMRSL